MLNPTSAFWLGAGPGMQQLSAPCYGAEKNQRGESRSLLITTQSCVPNGGCSLLHLPSSAPGSPQLMGSRGDSWVAAPVSPSLCIQHCYYPFTQEGFSGWEAQVTATTWTQPSVCPCNRHPWSPPAPCGEGMLSGYDFEIRLTNSCRSTAFLHDYVFQL